jgi:iron complex transport system substrate-binding protein
MRIVSLLPSATEILCGLGLRDQLVGVTHECDFPPSVSGLPKVTKTRIPELASSLEIDTLVREKLQDEKALYSLDAQGFESLQPDLIVTQTLCDVCAVAQTEVERAASGLHNRPTIVNLEPPCLADLYSCIRQIASAVDSLTNRSAERSATDCSASDCSDRAESYVGQLQKRVDLVAERSKNLALRPRVMLLEWIDPLFSAGHWNPELVALAGGHEVLGIPRSRSQTISWEKLVAAAPEVMVIACCGFDVRRALQDLPILAAHPAWRLLPCVQAKRVYVVDGSAYFSRPGPRLIDSLEILAHTLHPHLHPLPPGLEAPHRVG